MPETTETIEWIDVNERMPDDGSDPEPCRRVMIAFADRHAVSPVVEGAYRRKGSWRWQGGKLLRQVTHWAEMPKGPPMVERKDSGV